MPLFSTPTKIQFQFSFHDHEDSEKMSLRIWSDGVKEKKQKIEKNVIVIPQNERISVKVSKIHEGKDQVEEFGEVCFNPEAEDGTIFVKNNIYKNYVKIQERPWIFCFNYQMKRQNNVNFVGEYIKQKNVKRKQRKQSSIQLPSFLTIPPSQNLSNKLIEFDKQNKNKQQRFSQPQKSRIKTVNNFKPIHNMPEYGGKMEESTCSNFYENKGSANGNIKEKGLCGNKNFFSCLDWFGEEQKNVEINYIEPRY